MEIYNAGDWKNKFTKIDTNSVGFLQHLIKKTNQLF